MTARAQAVLAPTRRVATHLGGYKFLSMGRTDKGCVRTLNEDALLERAEIGLWAVADGMGGHDCGEVASARVVEALSEVDSVGSAYAFRHGVCSALQEANSALLEQAAERMSGPIGATVVALLMYQGHYACVWAGDSRAYLCRNKEVRRLTRDHTVVQALVDSGALKQDNARGHRQANVITRAVGAHAQLELDSIHGRIQPGDRFLLCSDGLTAIMGDAEIGELMMRSPLQSAVDALISRALSRGAPDNVTAVVVTAEGPTAQDLTGDY
ncbi:MAG TPA: protein phosphatase 2C domain-containing protein [Vitreimonas sp.]|uniref:PP2C family protein-serine/threonine phosphatase n=1 Tax=Vitreimonas sp. TaxID=3069702 RepID=UPI002D4D9E5A|nr:protein phosphatase 2C domain-containing protein [Vitreimonas sp.]HYD87780.1 protein phosphatase 2C domain-containing protein [Vitreimonas sp.]